MVSGYSANLLFLSSRWSVPYLLFFIYFSAGETQDSFGAQLVSTGAYVPYFCFIFLLRGVKCALIFVTTGPPCMFFGRETQCEKQPQQQRLVFFRGCENLFHGLKNHYLGLLIDQQSYSRF